MTAYWIPAYTFPNDTPLEVVSPPTFKQTFERIRGAMQAVKEPPLSPKLSSLKNSVSWLVSGPETGGIKYPFWLVFWPNWTHDPSANLPTSENLIRPGQMVPRPAICGAAKNIVQPLV